MAFDKQKQSEIQSALAHNSGAGIWYKTSWPKIIVTEGVQDMAERCEAFWLIDSIAAAFHKYRQQYPGEVAKRASEFCLATLFVTEDFKEARSAKLVLAEDTTAKRERDSVAFDLANFINPFVTKIHMTDFPLEEITFWIAPTEYEGEMVSVIYLPSEH